MFNIDPAKLLVILVVALVVMGPEKLPRAARQLGSAWRTFTEYREKAEAELRKAVPDLPSIPTNPRASVSKYMADLITPSTTPSSTTPDTSGSLQNDDSPPVEVRAPSEDESPPLAGRDLRPEIYEELIPEIYEDLSMN